MLLDWRMEVQSKIRCFEDVEVYGAGFARYVSWGGLGGGGEAYLEGIR